MANDELITVTVQTKALYEILFACYSEGIGTKVDTPEVDKLYEDIHTWATKNNLPVWPTPEEQAEMLAKWREKENLKKTLKPVWFAEREDT